MGRETTLERMQNLSLVFYFRLRGDVLCIGLQALAFEQTTANEKTRGGCQTSFVSLFVFLLFSLFGRFKIH